ncbi:hypothetical protein AOG2_23700 [Geobacter sp. AOG2]|nr:hypothetical protein AOG2_23700 [Geobacter sp. AOG2]
MAHRLRMALLSVLIVVVGGCAAGTVVVLTPDPGGKTGAITVSNQAGSVDVASPNQATAVTSNTQAPPPPAAMSQDAINALFSDALSVQPKPPVHYLLYFEKDLVLTPDSAGLLPGILAAIKERDSTDISVVGHTDTVGSREYNLALSKNRADSVRDLLVRKGVDPRYIKVSSHGKENPLIKTADNVSEPRNRRVEVVVR